MNQTILLPSMGKIEGLNGLFSLGMATGLEGKPVKLRLKFNLVSHSVRAKETLNTYIIKI